MQPSMALLAAELQALPARPRGRPPGPRREDGKRKYEVQKLWQRHHEMSRLLLLGYGNKEIAQVLGCTPQNVSDVRNSEVFKKRMAVLDSQRDGQFVDVAQSLQKEAPPSLRILIDARDNENLDTFTRVKVAQDLLDRAGYGKVQRMEAQVTHGHLDIAAIDRIKKRAKEAHFEEI